MRSILREWPRLDPRTGIAVFALWAGLCGITLAGPGDAYATSGIYAVLRLYTEEHVTGAGMLISAAALVWCIRPATGLSFRLFAGWACGTFWMLIGGALVLGGAESGVISTAGLFSLLGGAGCVFSIRQWMVQP